MVISYNLARRAGILMLAISVLTLVASAGGFQDKEAEKPKGTGWLGVMIADVTKSLAKDEQLKTESGAYVKDVVKDSPAESAGVKEGDVIISFDGKEMRDASDLTEAVRKSSPGKKTTLTVIRNGDKKDLSVTVGKLPSREAYALKIPPAPVVPRELAHVFIGTGVLGMEVRTLNEQLAAYFGAPNDEGVLIESVDEGSPAEKAGFKAGDVIIRVGKKLIDEVDEIHRALRKFKEGDKVEFEVIRKGDRKVLTYTKEAAPESGVDRFFRVTPKSRIMIDGGKKLKFSTPDLEEHELHLQIERLDDEMRQKEHEMQKVIKKKIRIDSGSDV